MCNDLSNYDYVKRLKKSNLLSFEMRRLRADMVEVYKIVHGLEGIQFEELFEFRMAHQEEHHTRGHNYKIYKQRARQDARKYFLSQ